ncbi:hypothetical protein KCU67_g79, partial [Aureobasidium melanogenum]
MYVAPSALPSEIWSTRSYREGRRGNLIGPHNSRTLINGLAAVVVEHAATSTPHLHRSLVVLKLRTLLLTSLVSIVNG